MKTLVESILDQEQHIKKANKKAESVVEFEKFKSDFENILKSFGIAIKEIDGYTQENPVCYHSRSMDVPSTSTKEHMVDKYVISYNHENEYNKNKYSYRENSFKLHIFLWNDTTLGRPRYCIEDFQLLLPGIRVQGYGLDSIGFGFGAKKIEPKYYHNAIAHIKDVISHFIDGRSKMNGMFIKCNGRNPQRVDYTKVTKTIFADLIK